MGLNIAERTTATLHNAYVNLFRGLSHLAWTAFNRTAVEERQTVMVKADFTQHSMCPSFNILLSHQSSVRHHSFFVSCSFVSHFDCFSFSCCSLFFASERMFGGFLLPHTWNILKARNCGERTLHLLSRLAARGTFISCTIYFNAHLKTGRNASPGCIQASVTELQPSPPFCHT